MSNSKVSIKHGKPSHKEVTMAKLEVFKKKIEMDEDMGRLGPNNKLIEGKELPLHYMS